MVFLLIIATLLSRSMGNRILQVTIVVPPNLINYYEWLTAFPRETPSEKPHPIENESEYGQSPNQNSIYSSYGA